MGRSWDLPVEGTAQAAPLADRNGRSAREGFDGAFFVDLTLGTHTLTPCPSPADHEYVVPAGEGEMETCPSPARGERSKWLSRSSSATSKR